MPKKVIKKIAEQKSVKSVKISAMKTSSLLSQIKWGESYTSLFLGAVVVLVAFVLLFSLIKSKPTMKTETTSTSTVANQQILPTVTPKTYTVKDGEYLWVIAEKIYGSGYNWVDLADANKLQNPGVLYVGTKLVVPDVKPRMLTVQNNQAQPANAITGNSYTVVKGDYLWNIAIRAYEDGYKWTEIAKTNNLANPSLIFAGNVLKLPR